MILLLAVIGGILAGALRAKLTHQSLSVPPLAAEWLVPLAVVPQLFAFFIPATEGRIDQQSAALILVGSQILLLLFVGLNRTSHPLLLLGAGLLLNFIVIVSNGGLMPISPATVLELDATAPVAEWQSGQRVSGTKDVLLAEDAMRFGWLADRFVLPPWSPIRVAYSIGDLFIAAGGFWFFWQAGGGASHHSEGRRMSS